MSSIWILSPQIFGFIAPVFVVLLNLVDLDLGVLKMDQNPEDQPIDRKCIKKLDFERANPGQPYQDPNPDPNFLLKIGEFGGGDNCDTYLSKNWMIII